MVWHQTTQRAAVLWRHSSPSLLWDISIPFHIKWNPISLVEQTNFETLNVILWGERVWGKPLHKETKSHYYIISHKYTPCSALYPPFFLPLPQGTTQCCAVHCLMNLLQVPNYPSAPDLSLPWQLCAACSTCCQRWKIVHRHPAFPLQHGKRRGRKIDTNMHTTQQTTLLKMLIKSRS